jgi:hypothetical protein
MSWHALTQRGLAKATAVSKLHLDADRSAAGTDLAFCPGMLRSNALSPVSKSVLIGVVLVIFGVACGASEHEGEARDAGGAKPSADGASMQMEAGDPDPGIARADSSVVQADAGDGGEMAFSSEPPVTTIDVLGVARGDGHFVAVGRTFIEVSGQSHAVVYTSSDGFDWVHADADPELVLTDIAFGNGVFVAVGNAADDHRACTSADGTDFQCMPLGDAAVDAGAPRWGDAPQTLAFGNGTFVTVVGPTKQVFRSTDGVNWQAATQGPALAWLGGVEYGAGTFVVWGRSDAGTEQVMQTFSSDADKWSDAGQPVATHAVSRLFGSTDGFSGLTSYNCCFGETGGPWYGRVASTNGSNWTFEDGAPVVLVHEQDVCIDMRLPSGHSSNDARSVVTASPECEATASVREADGIDPLVALHDGPAYIVAGYGGLVSSRDGLNFKRTLRIDLLVPGP